MGFEDDEYDRYWDAPADWEALSESMHSFRLRKEVEGLERGYILKIRVAGTAELLLSDHRMLELSRTRARIYADENTVLAEKKLAEGDDHTVSVVRVGEVTRILVDEKLIHEHSKPPSTVFQFGVTEGKVRVLKLRVRRAG